MNLLQGQISSQSHAHARTPWPSCMAERWKFIHTRDSLVGVRMETGGGKGLLYNCNPSAASEPQQSPDLISLIDLLIKNTSPVWFSAPPEGFPLKTVDSALADPFVVCFGVRLGFLSLDLMLRIKFKLLSWFIISSLSLKKQVLFFCLLKDLSSKTVVHASEHAGRDCF